MSRGRRPSLIALAAAAALLSFAPVAGAKTFTVTRTGDELTADCTKQRCSLRDALNAANVRTGPDEVVLRSGRTYTLSLPGAGEDTDVSGDLDVLEAVTIRADGLQRAQTTTPAHARTLGTALQCLTGIDIGKRPRQCRRAPQRLWMAGLHLRLRSGRDLRLLFACRNTACRPRR